MIWYIYRTTPSAKNQVSPAVRWGPFISLALGCFLLIIDPTRHVLLDHGGVFFSIATLAMYDGPDHLSPTGRFCQICSITGIILMIGGVMWHMRIPQTIVKSVGASGKSA